MKIEVWAIGQTSQKYLIPGIELYLNKLKHYIPFQYQEWAEKASSKSSDKVIALKNQADLILKKINTDDYLILLDEAGKEYNSIEWANYLSNKMLASPKRIIFLIGGAFGFDTRLIALAKEKISLSRMTFSHDMVRLFLLEQLYRGFSILKNEPYHNQ